MASAHRGLDGSARMLPNPPRLQRTGLPAAIDWLQLPGDVVWVCDPCPTSEQRIQLTESPSDFLQRIQRRMSLYELLSMGMACKCWFTSISPALQTVNLVAEVDLKRWSQAVYLLQKMFPHVTQLSVELPYACSDTATEHIQVLSRCSQLQHLDMTVYAETRSSATYMWFPALGRLTALRSLAVALPPGAINDIAGLSCLQHLTSLRVFPNNIKGGNLVSPDGPMDDAINTLAALDLKVLEYSDFLLPSVEVSRLQSLTSLAIINIDPRCVSKFLVEDLDTYHLEHMMALSRLPCLHQLSLSTKQCLTRQYRTSDHSGTAARASAFLDACSRHLTQVPALELRIFPWVTLEASSSTLGYLAKLTNLTALQVTFADYHPSASLACLWSLSWLQRLSVGINGEGAMSHESNKVCIWNRDVGGLCRSLRQLKSLKLALKPAWFVDGISSLQHLTLLTGLEELALILPTDGYPGRGKDPWLQVPAAYVPSTVVDLDFEGYQYVTEVQPQAS